MFFVGPWSYVGGVAGRGWQAHGRRSRCVPPASDALMRLIRWQGNKAAAEESRRSSARPARPARSRTVGHRRKRRGFENMQYMQHHGVSGGCSLRMRCHPMTTLGGIIGRGAGPDSPRVICRCVGSWSRSRC
jgi:hypothetical protein